MKSLIVDDDHLNRKILNYLLSPHGDCELAVDGEQAIISYQKAWKRKQPFDLICLDLMMPKASGLQVLTFIRQFEERKNIPREQRAIVFVVSASGDQSFVVGAASKGISAYFLKPVHKQKFASELVKHGLIKREDSTA